jgi:hypothetical protein
MILATTLGRRLGQTATAMTVVLSLLTIQAYGQSSARASASPFRGLAGSWAGNGTVTLSNGSEEQIRCRAKYAVGPAGNTLEQRLRCASASYKFDLSSDVAHRDGTISGHWTESTRNAGGTISGSVTRRGRIKAVVDGPGFSAILSVTTRGDEQSVELDSRGHEVTQVSITLHRA